MADNKSNVPGAMTTADGPMPTVVSDRVNMSQSPFLPEPPKGDVTKVAAGAGEALGRPEYLNVRKEHIAAEMAKNEQAELDARGGASNPFVN